MLKKISKAIILAGGKGTRISEQTKTIPKPLIKVGHLPIMLHIMRRLQHEGIKEFFILGGYLNEEIWSYLLRNVKPNTFPSNFSHEHLTLELKDDVLPNSTVHLINTGIESGTAERIKMVQDYFKDENFIITYGDSYSNVDVAKIESKLKGDMVVSLCAIPNVERFGLVELNENGDIKQFKEKSESTNEFVNGGFICVTPEIFDYIDTNAFDFSSDVLQSSQLKGKMTAYVHRDYWIPVDTQRDWEKINKDFINHPEYFI